MNKKIILNIAFLSVMAFGADCDKCTGENIAKDADKVIGTKYVWGGNSMTKGLDCSALVKNVYSKYGYKLPRVADDQARTTKECPTYHNLAEAQIGDALYFKREKDKNIHHTAIISGFTPEGLVVITHAKGENHGVIREIISKRYKKELFAIKRFHECTSPLSGDYSNKEIARMILDASLAFGVKEELFYQLIVDVSNMNPMLITARATSNQEKNILGRLQSEGINVFQETRKENIFYVVPRTAKEGEIIVEALQDEEFDLRVGLMQVSTKGMTSSKAKRMVYPFPNLVQAKNEFNECNSKGQLEQCFEF